jgi:hypothetical protein
VAHQADNDLFFGLRGAGSSLAIVTEFLYRISTEPETRWFFQSFYSKSRSKLIEVNNNNFKLLTNTSLKKHKFYSFVFIKLFKVLQFCVY